MHVDADQVKQKRILLVHLVSLGDCLYATAVARQIKQDYPGCHLTWAISSRCSQVIQNNPYVDEIWEVFHEKMSDAWSVAWEETKRVAIKRKNSGHYDQIFFTQLYPDNFFNYDGTIRSSTFRCYPNPITVSVDPIIVLTDIEIKNVKNFADIYKLSETRQVILFESSPGSIQSPMNSHLALEIAKKIVEGFEDVIVILSSNQKMDTGHPRIVDGSVLSFKENAELAKYCNLLIGCSSGITWLLTSTWAKKLPTIQILKKRAITFEFASVSYDLKYWGQSTDHIIEITRFDSQYIFNCVKMVLENGVENARVNYDEFLKPSPVSLILIVRTLILTKKFKKIFYVARNFYERNDDSIIIVAILVIIAIPYSYLYAILRYFFSIFKKAGQWI